MRLGVSAKLFSVFRLVYQSLAVLHCFAGMRLSKDVFDPLLSGVDLVIFDNLSTPCTNGSESASDAWVPMQNWLLRLRRQGIAVLLVHHAGTNGGQDAGAAVLLKCPYPRAAVQKQPFLSNCFIRRASGENGWKTQTEHGTLAMS